MSPQVRGRAVQFVRGDGTRVWAMLTSPTAQLEILDALHRRPYRPYDLAQLLDMPYATANNRAACLVEAGLVVRRNAFEIAAALGIPFPPHRNRAGRQPIGKRQLKGATREALQTEGWGPEDLGHVTREFDWAGVWYLPSHDGRLLYQALRKREGGT